nr:MAG TPA: hypothetical protein [Caudoviricetes sp.]
MPTENYRSILVHRYACETGRSWIVDGVII